MKWVTTSWTYSMSPRLTLENRNRNIYRLFFLMGFNAIRKKNSFWCTEGYYFVSKEAIGGPHSFKNSFQCVGRSLLTSVQCNLELSIFLSYNGKQPGDRWIAGNLDRVEVRVARKVGLDIVSGPKDFYLQSND